MGIREWIIFIVLSCLWGSSFLFIEIAVGQLQPLTVAFARVAISAILLLIALKLLKIKVPISPEILIFFFVLGLFNNAIPFSLISWGQTQITSGLASIFNATMPIFTILVTHFFTSDEKMDRYKVAGVLLGFCGVIYMIGIEELLGLGAGILGQLAVLTAAFFYASSTTYGRRFRTMGIPALGVAAGQMVAASLVLIPFVLIFDQPWQLPAIETKVIFSVLSLGCFSTALAYFLYFKLLQSSGATNLSLVTFVIPLVAIFLGWSVLGERLESEQIIGMITIIAGLALIDGRFFKKTNKNN